MGTSRNRTTWPVRGGALAIQPGWFQGHATAFFYINMGFGIDGPDQGPHNFSFPMVPLFQITGPSKGPYPGTFCLPQVPLPVNASVKAGDLATIQVVEVAVHGASLYNVSAIQYTFPLYLSSFGLTRNDIVRRHRLRRARKRRRGKPVKLLQFQRHRV
jgi:hypothetical protein